MAGRNTRRKKRRSGGALYVTVIGAIMLFAAIIGVSVFFKVSEINVTGIDAYTDDTVRELAGIELDSSIFFLNESSAAIKLKEALPYIDEVRIIRKFPGTVTIDITESYPIACVEASGSLWIIDKNAKILERTVSSAKGDAIEILGIEPIMPAVGDTLALGDDGVVQLTYLKQILTEMLRSGVYKDVKDLDITNISSVNFRYKDRFTVILGKGDAVEDKLWMLQKIVTSYNEDVHGTIDISNENEGHFIPD